MTESCGICAYLAEKYGKKDAPSLSVAPAESDYGDFLNWMYHADATLTFPQTILLRYTVHEPGRADTAASDYQRWYIARLKRLQSTLSDGRDFLCSNRFTIADVCITYALFLGTTLKGMDGSPLSDAYAPETKAYLERMLQREGWKNAQIAQRKSAAEFRRTEGAWSRL